MRTRGEKTKTWTFAPQHHAQDALSVTSSIPGASAFLPLTCLSFLP